MVEPYDTAALFRRYGAPIQRRCRRMLGDDEAARDAAQEVFLRAFASGERFRAESSPFTWLYGIATMYCLQQLRNRGRRAQKLQLVTAPEEAVARDQGARIDVARIFEAADETVQAMAYLRWVDGLSLEEVSEVVGISRKTVAKRLETFRVEARLLLEGDSP